MRIIEMERKTIDGKPYDDDYDPHDWWCVLETREEEYIYEMSWHDTKDEKYLSILNELIVHAGQGMGVCWGDDDMYGYFRPDDTEPEVGEEYVDNDGDTWVRTY